ncbi:hypothetical protein BGZ61DRAFT_222129 [Ilyonectria robusta]|uniref:uncharacterized protein n=1 Tax=Ilyonectria robusta TaxID=1079257 RepID=UPI001E8D84A4|nr:uncharacterized protein BGZ61DRAFT_222129 [Ilyonectria robusta]KAH8706498.1 hypothetical protein BGZ61DRAFT_222129 [Ilyonectria robusta]
MGRCQPSGPSPLNPSWPPTFLSFPLPHQTVTIFPFNESPKDVCARRAADLIGPRRPSSYFNARRSQHSPNTWRNPLPDGPVELRPGIESALLSHQSMALSTSCHPGSVARLPLHTLKAEPMLQCHSCRCRPRPGRHASHRYQFLSSPGRPFPNPLVDVTQCPCWEVWWLSGHVTSKEGKVRGPPSSAPPISPFVFLHLRYCHVLVKLCQLINGRRFLGRAALGRVSSIVVVSCGGAEWTS